MSVAAPPPGVEMLLSDAFFAPIRAIVETAGITRKCNCLDDLTFAILCELGPEIRAILTKISQPAQRVVQTAARNAAVPGQGLEIATVGSLA